MADASSAIPMRRSTDQMTRRDRWRAWWAENGVQVVVFVLLAVIVAGEASDYFNDREQTRRDAAQERRDDYQACVLGNAVEQGAESLRRLRIQAPVIEAAGDLLTASTPEERQQIEHELAAALEQRDRDLLQVGVDELPSPAECPAP